MAYSDFIAYQLAREFGVEFRGGDLLAPARPLAPSAWLAETLRIAGELGVGGFKASAERIVSPILTDIARRNNFGSNIASGRPLDADPGRGLSGTCDFVLSLTRVQDFIQAPVCCVTVRQGPDTVDELAECAAQLVGAARLTRQQGRTVPVVYGCTTTGTEWQFLKLESNLCTIHHGRYFTFDLPALLGVLQQIVDRTRPAHP